MIFALILALKYNYFIKNLFETSVFWNESRKAPFCLMRKIAICDLQVSWVVLLLFILERWMCWKQDGGSYAKFSFTFASRAILFCTVELTRNVYCLYCLQARIVHCLREIFRFEGLFTYRISVARLSFAAKNYC